MPTDDVAIFMSLIPSWSGLLGCLTGLPELDHYVLSIGRFRELLEPGNKIPVEFYGNLFYGAPNGRSSDPLSTIHFKSLQEDVWLTFYSR